MAVEAIQAAGGTVIFDYQESGPRTWTTAGTPRGPKWLRERLGPEYFDTPVYIGQFGSPPSREWVAAFNQLPSIKTLLLSGIHADDETLEKLAGSMTLIELHLSASAITDDGLKQLSKFPNLRWLVLNNTGITDAGIPYLAKLQHLQELHLQDTATSIFIEKRIHSAMPGVKVVR
jgi:Leucine-rich repeat (LRR) protein